MIECMELDGVTYNREMIEEVRQAVIKMRNSALQDLGKPEAAERSVMLSHTVALLTHLKNNTSRD